MKSSENFDTVAFATDVRRLVLQVCHQKQTAHLGSALSVIDMLSVLLLEEIRQPLSGMDKDKGDFLLLSKGHAALALYSCLYKLGFLSEDQLNSFSDPGSILEEHPNHYIPTVPFPTGSLGHGLPLGCGLALGAKIKKLDRRVFVVMSDGECNEGTVWESTQFARTKNLDNLYVLVDHNKLQATGSIAESLSDISLAANFTSFQWNVKEVEGHDHLSIIHALKHMPNNGRPNALICHTIKGKGVSFMEHDNNWHYKSPNSEELNKALIELTLHA